jgi:hypothetical protein
MPYGTLTTFDSLAASQATIAQIGEDSAWAGIAARLAAANALEREMLGDLVEITTDRQRRYGGGGDTVMDEVGEFGRSDAQKPADRLLIQRQIKRALFTPTNVTFKDRLVDWVDLPVKALVNADSAEIPVGPNGETFDGATHTHYLGSAALDAAAVNAVILAVAEHTAMGDGYLYIARGNETAFRALTGFTPYYDMRVNPGANAAQGTAALDPLNLNDRAIGIWNGGTGSVEVWVKPWVPTSYLVAFVKGIQPPLVMRERRPGAGDLLLVADDETHPLRARAWEREFGIGVWNRTGAAVSYVANATYATPTFS